MDGSLAFENARDGQPAWIHGSDCPSTTGDGAILAREGPPRLVSNVPRRICVVVVHAAG
jgi:hypothetical protein